MKKKLMCLAITVIMAVGMTMTANAADYQGKDGWKVEFDGNDMNSNFESKDLTDEAVNIQPGDSIQLKVQIKNSSTGETDWYMTNEVIRSLEDAKAAASGGAYEYRLSFVGSSGADESVLYDSETVGGDGSAQSGEGLHQASDTLEDYFYLDRLNSGESGTVYLRIKIDGETQGNGYQRTLARLQMNFAVEEVAEGGTGIDRVIRQTVKTGDTTQVMLFCGLALASGIVLLVIGIYSMKRRKTNRKGE